jgi:methylmalonyl-CoA/ethylmalonyl-CoA epimerase
MVTVLSHVSIAVPDLEAAARQLHDKYALNVGARVVNAEQGVRLAYVELGAAKIELMEPSRPDSPIAKFLERNPKGGIHHFCLGVDDVEKAAHAFAQNGVRLLGAGKPQRSVAGEPIAFVHPGDFLGALVELEEHKG